MTKLAVGPATLLIPDGVEREVEVNTFGQDHIANESPAVVTGPGGLLLEIAYRRWRGGGHVVGVARSDGPAVFDVFERGRPLGIQEREDGTDSCDIGLMKRNPAKPISLWGNAVSVDVDELDQVLGASTDAILWQARAYGFDRRANLLGDMSPRKNWLCATFPAHDPVGPLVAFVLTRILPVLRGIEAGLT